MRARNAQFLKNLQRFRLITFDVTDTLLRFREPPSVQYAKTAAALGLRNINEEQLQICFRKSFREMSARHPNYGCGTPGMTWQQWWIALVKNIFACVDPSIPAQKREEIAETLLQLYRTKTCWAHVDGGPELLRKIRTTNKILGVISNFDASLPKVLQEMDVSDYFDFILTSYNAGVQKPHAGIFRIPLKAYSVAPQEALHIGNLYDIDYVGAQNAGWSSLLLTRSDAEAKDARSSHHYKTLRDMLTALETTDIKW